MSRRDDKKEQILNAGIEVMKRKGYNGTSVKDIVDAAAVPKGSFYNYFESKEQFAIDALDHVASQSHASSRSILLERQSSPAERLRQYFQVGADMAACCGYEGGCFFGNMCQEMSDTSEAIRAKVQRVLRDKTGLIAEVIAEAQQRGEMHSAIAPGVLAEFLFNAWEGAVMRSKATKSCSPIQAFLDTLPLITR